MNNKKTILGLFFAVVLFASGIYVGIKINTNGRPPNGQILVSKAEYDSIMNLTPEIIIKDSLIISDTVIIRTAPKIYFSDSDVNIYTDSIVDDSTHLIIKDWVKGEILNREIELSRSFVYREVKVPYPQFITATKLAYPKNKFGVYMGGVAVGNFDSQMTGIELGFITRKKSQFGGIVLTDFNKKYIGLTVKKIIEF